MVFRRFWVLLSGTTAAQILPLISAPIIARGYDAAEFGIFGIYLAIAAICATVANFKYENAILATHSRAATNAILGLSIFINIGIGLVITLIVSVAILMGWQIPMGMPLALSIFMPVSVMLAGMQQAMSNVALQKEQFALLAKSRFVAALTTAALSVLAALTYPTAAALIAATLVGQIAGLLLLIYKCQQKNQIKPSFQSSRLRALALRQWRFAFYTSPADLLNALGSNLPAIFLGSLYGTAATGAYVLAQRLVGTPLMLVGSAFSDLYRQQVGQRVSDKRPYWGLSLKLLAITTPIGASALALVLVFSEAGSKFFLGDQWDLAGTICSIMVWVYVLRFIVSPLTYSFYVAKRHAEDLGLQAVSILAVSTVYLAGKYLHWAVETYVSALAWSLSIMYASYGTRALQFARRSRTVD